MSTEHSGDIAITGLALRLPGADTLDELHGHLVAGRSLIREVPAERWSQERWFGDPRRGAEKTSSIWGGFLEGADRFDADFFAISPREAESMDPQQRFALELSWQAVEDAGYRAAELAGTRTGVFMGVCHQDYAELMEREGAVTDAYFPTGTAYSIIANRVSYSLDLQGPSITNDTACSSSLVSVYEAVSALQRGECEQALAGGVNLVWSPKHFVAFSQASMLSRTGRSKAFDQDADGYVRGEGGAVLLLKPLERAVADGDPVHAVIKGVATNHGGRTSSLTVTNPSAQSELIEGLYARAGIRPDSVSYIEAHGPGTQVGDPIEVVALKRAFAALHERHGTEPRPGSTGIGSIKTNIGHLEGAAGVAGMVKVIAAMAGRTLPATVHFEKQNPMIKLDGSPFFIVEGTQEWPDGAAPRRAGVSSFGFGGTNAHVVLEEHPDGREREPIPGPQLVPLSAKNPDRVRAVAQRLAAHLRGQDGELADVAHTLQVGREPMAVRAAFVVDGIPELIDALEEFASGSSDAVVRGDAAAPELREAAERWVGGEDLDWSALRGDGPRPRRVRLPVYPFDRQRYWFRVPERSPETGGALHPLLHRNTSDLAEQRYTSTFTGTEPFLSAHRVGGARVLPAVAYLEMVRAAAERAFADGAAGVPVVRGATWLRPVVAGDEPAEVNLALVPGETGASFEVYAGDRDEAVVHARGSVEIAAVDRPEPVDLDRLRAACPRRRDVEEVYAEFREQGLEYGPAMRGLREIFPGRRELLARIEPGAESGDGVVLAPAVLDAAFQASVALLDADPAGGPAMPFALESLEVFAPCTAETWAWVRYRDGAPDTFDIDLCDAGGQVRARLRGLVQRRDRSRTLVTATTGWVEQAASPEADVPEVHAFYAGKSLPDGLAATHLPLITPDGAGEGVERTAHLLLERVQEVLRGSPTRPQRFVVLVDDRLPRHFHASLTGLFRTVALENPLVSGRVVRVAGTARVAEVLRVEAADASGDAEVHHAADGTRRVRRPIEAARPAGPRVPALREGGVYWVTGGLGGLGRHVARYFARAGAVVVLSGRSAPGAALEELRESGVHAHHLVADVTDAEDVLRAAREIVREHGRLDGIVHAAGVLADDYLLRKDLDDVRGVLAPKVRGALHLDAASRELDLDFFALFSSVAGVYGGTGQADYAAANAFLDAFAEHRQVLVSAGERTGRTVAISWPLWADGGMTADEVTREAMRRRRGWEPLPTESGLRALGGLLEDGPEHAIVAYGADPVLVPRETTAPSTSDSAVAGEHSAQELAAGAVVLLKDLLGQVLHRDPDAIDGSVNLVEYGIDSLSILDMTTRLEDRFGPLSKTLFFEHTTLDGVAGYFAAEHPGTLATLLGDAGAELPETPSDTGKSAEQRPRFARASVTAEPAHDPRAQRHDIAVIGLSGRYPGAENPDLLWTALEEGRHAFTEVPRDRWNHDAIYSPDRDVLGKSSIRTGTFLDGIDEFDPRYFRVSKRAAEQMSPEVRLFLQAGVQALEDAGYSRETLQRDYDGDVGVLAGTMSNHYNLYGFAENLLRGAPASGSYTATLPNMLSYFYGFTGPSIFVDTMCSAASTCIHQAVQMLRAGETRMVVAGGVNLLLHPYNLISSSQEHFTTATSDIIRSYGVGADGTILGEGVGAVVLKPLVEAERDGDHVYAVIKGTALSNAGVRNGFTVPNPHMQARAVGKALDDAGVDARTIGYVEGHGSGTALGDPIEVKALTTAFREHTADSGYCALGSVKSNVGHLLAAAGMAGFTKVLLQLRAGKLAPSLHSERLNPDIPFDGTPFRVQRELADWEPITTTDDGRPVVHPRRAGITSIGAGGMNSHIIVEEHPGAVEREPGDGRDELFVFSAMTDRALQESLTRFRAFLAAAEETDLSAIAHTLRVGKNELPRRWAFLAADKATALAAVDRYLAGDHDPVLAGRDERAETPREVARTWLEGKPVDWSRVVGARPPRRVSLPSYPFERVRCWVPQDSEAPGVLAPLALREKVHPLLGRNESDVDGLRFGLDLNFDDLRDYAVQRDGVPELVGSFAVEVALAAARAGGFGGPVAVRGLRSASVPWSRAARLVTGFGGVRGGTGSGVVFSEDAAGERTPVVAFDVLPGEPVSGSAGLPQDVRGAATEVLDRERIAAELAEGGLVHEPLFCGVAGACRLPDGRLVLEVAEPQVRRDHVRRNTTFDAPVLAAIAQGVLLEAKRAGEPRWQHRVLEVVDEVRVRETPEIAHVVLELRDGRGRVLLVDRDGGVAGELTGVRCGEGTALGAAAPTPAFAAVTAEPVVHAHAPQEPTAQPGAPDGELDSVVDELRAMAADLLKFEVDELDPHTGFDAFGFDSISLVALAKKIHARFGVELTPAVFFDESTFDALGRHLLAEHGDHVRASDTEPTATVSSPAPEPISSSTEDHKADEPIAIIGAAGRFPGARDLDEFWANLLAGRDSVGPFPVERYDSAYAQVIAESDFPKHAGTLERVDAFDAGFFGIYPREAELMDPQHRLALETVWHAVEDSGRTPDALPRDTGLFFGVSGTDYATLLHAHGVAPDAFTATGNAHSILVNRISYLLDIRGPSEPVDTACSSSLVAVHRAAEAIRSGACELAIAGGVNLLLSADTFVSAHRAGMLSPDGRCKTFSAEANGYVRGEGVGAIVLKPLSAAERDGDAVLAVLRGTAENHGGRANSLTAPNADAQAELVRTALAGLDPATIGYVEAHGTGTALGDPVEVRALHSAFGRAGAGSGRTGLGSVKATIGHLEAAAGIAGVLKVLLSMRHGVLPATPVSGELNPHIRLDDGPFRIVRETERWEPTGAAPLRAGVSSFGFGGANAHVVLEQHVATARPEVGGPVLVPLSARTDAQLRDVARNLLAHLDNSSTQESLASLGWTLQSGRVALDERAGWVVNSRAELIARLGAFLDGDLTDGVRGRVARRPGGLAERPAGPDEQRALERGDLTTALAAWAEGAVLDWRVLHGERVPGRAHLPTYPFERERHWIPTAAEPDAPQPASSPDDAGDDVGTTLLTPRWTPRPASADRAAVGERVVITCGPIGADLSIAGVRHERVTSEKSRADGRFTELSRQVFEVVRDLEPQTSALVQVVAPADDATGPALAGLLRTAEQENPRLAGQVLLLPEDTAAEDVRSALDDNATSTDDLVLYRDGTRHVRTWHRAEPPARHDTPWRAGGVYLITGGARGIGAAVARHIAASVSGPRLVLAGRSAPDAEVAGLLDELRAAGATADYRQADVSRWEETRHLVASVRADAGDLHGVVHSAGVVRDAALARKTTEDWDEVLAPKVSGLVHLDRATAQLPLDLLIAFSSGAGITGNAGQADYAAANAFTDAYASMRAADRPGRTLAIAWPLWRDGGMAVDAAGREKLRRSRGLVPMNTTDGLAALESACALDTPQVWVHHGDRTRAPGEVPAAGDGLRRAVQRKLVELFAETTKLPAAGVDPDRQLAAMGLDSIMVVQLNRELARGFDGLPTTLFYEFPALSALAAHLADERTAEAAAWTGYWPEAAPRPVESRPEPVPARPAEAAAEEPIAIIGLSGRYPQARNLPEFWENLRAGRTCIGEVPADRWPLEGFYEPDRKTAIATGRSYSKWGGFLDGFAEFDPRFFRIAPRDAYAMDPQERLFVQAAWEVLEDAGYTRDLLAERHSRNVGVFAGVTKSGHARHGAGLLPSGEAVVPGLSFASLSARTSHVLDLRGPSITLDTMCSASLTAVHEACEHLRRGSCEVAIAGGANVYAHPLDYVELCRSQMLSAGPECRSFGAGADGFVPGEGVGAVLLKPLSRALADGDRVEAVVLGSSANHGGGVNGYTVPNPAAQADLVRDALAQAGISARDVGCVEAHGTGTELGDPIEIAGLTKAFGADTGDLGFCALSSVKSGIGHLEAAAGIAGLTKAVLQLRHRTLAPSLHADEPNPGISFERTPFFLQREAREWDSDRPRVAAVSSFGAGGSNAHVIVAEHVAEPEPAGSAGEQLVVLSARTEEELRRAAGHLVSYVDAAEPDLAALAHTTRTGREAMAERLAVVVSSAQQLRRVLAQVAGGDFAGVHRGTADRPQGALAVISADPELREQLVRRWAATGELDKLAALWVDGVRLDWRALDGDGTRPPRPISMPTYPFSRERYWIGDLPPAAVAGADPNRADQVVEPVPSTAPAAVPDATPAEPPKLEVVVPRLVREKLAGALAMRPDEIDGEHAFADYGLDSILGVRVVHELNDALSLELSTNAIYDFSSADRLVEHLLTEHAADIRLAEPLTESPAESESGVVERVSAEGVSISESRSSGDPGEPIAVVGMSGRFAGSADLDELWEHLAAGHDLVTPVTRWDLGDSDTGEQRCEHGSFVDGIDEFDPLFFTISGVEAAVMDPQQRLLLEESWKALEDAGYAGTMGRRRCGVYVGAWAGDYQDLLAHESPAQTLWGNMTSVIPSRVSYFLDLRGPAIAVDTSCSSSLVAIDLACKDLRAGETSMALAGGVFLQSTPRLYRLAGRAGMLSPTGRCRTFDHRADGFVPGEGVGVLVLKRLSDALADGDHVHGVIRGSGVGQDGATNGITAPSSVSQERLLREVHEESGVDVERIGLVEAHGTGTPLGDPIEFQALQRAFRARTDRSGYCAVGSIKTNIGHSQYAAGVAGVIKVLLSMRHEQIPAALHFERANPEIRLDGSPFYVNTRTQKWAAEAGPRCGVVSSFGASGTNAHVVLEEAPAPRRSAAPRRAAHLVVLSARSRDQLAEQVARLAAHCRRDPAVDCGDLAHTLLAGRAHFEHRFACVAGDVAELIEVLDGGLDSPRARTGRKQPGAGDAAEQLRRCREADGAALRAELDALAERYVAGAALDAAELFPAGAYLRVPLPTYPFARERYWPETRDGGPETPPAAEETTRSEFVVTGSEPHVRDHRVQGRRVLPAVAYLERARQAGERVLGADPVLRDVTWVRPLTVEDGPVTAEVRVEPAGSGFTFEIAAESGGERAVRCAGRLTGGGGAAPEPVDLAALREECPTPVSAERIRDALAGMGIEHGPALRAVALAHVGRGVVLAELRAPAERTRSVLDPALLDSAIQASIALQLADGDAATTTAVPFALESLQRFGPCEERMWAVVRASGEPGPLSRLDVDLVDTAGAVRVRMAGYTSRRAPAPEQQAAPEQAVPALFEPVWEPVGAAEFGAPLPSAADRVLVVGGTEAQRAAVAAAHPAALGWNLPSTAEVEEIAAALAELGPIDHLVWLAPEAPLPTGATALTAAQETGVLAAFRMLKALLRSGFDGRDLGITLLTRRAVPTCADDPVEPAHAGLHGLFGSAAREYPHWRVRRVDVDGEVWPADLTTLTASPDDVWVRRSGQWLRRRLVPAESATAPSETYRRDAVFAVIGGAGGLGVEWTRHVVEHYGATVVWIGRRERDEDIERKLASIPGEVHYLSADATDPAALRAAREEIIARCGPIRGLVQAALVLRDQSLARMSERDFRAGLAAKVDVSAAAAEVFADDPLDFALFFSSLQSFTTAAGQSNYAAGCLFADSYAHDLGQRWNCPVKVVHWGWWGSVGSVATEFFARRMRGWGLRSIEPAEGMAALDELFAAPQRQLSYIGTTAPDALDVVDPGTRSTAYARTGERVDPELLRSRGALGDGPLLDSLARWRSTERDPLLARVLRAHLAELGITESAAHADVTALRERAGIREQYTSWLEHALRATPDAAEPLEEVTGEWRRTAAEWQRDPDKAAEVRLVSATLAELPAILTGRTPATDVLFPRGSVELVEGCYRDNRLADAFNRALREAAVAVVAERVRREPGAKLRILEIGAGTGGTSAGMFTALRPYQDSIETYTYTDLSKAFLNHARTAYGPDVPYLECALFDAERPLAGQDVEPGSYDLVIAANVLHATRDTRNTLRNAKAALRDGGWLLLNELAAFDVFTHLTFGLLDGWWLFEDTALRVPGSPALSPDSWRAVLAGEGFSSVVQVLPEALPLGQQIIAAESDGIARQRLVEGEEPPAAAPRPAHGGSASVAAPAASPLGGAVPAAPTPRETPCADRPTGNPVDRVRERAAAVLHLPVDRIDPAVPLTDYGLDSILVLQLVNALREDVPEISPAMVFDAGTIDGIAALAPSGPAPEPQHAAEPDLAERIRQRAASVLGVAADRIDPAAPLTDYGLDSILVLQLVNALREDLPEISPAMVFDAGTIDGLLARSGSRRRWELSGSQRLIHRDHVRWGGSSTYNLPLLFEIGGELDEAALERAVRELARLHPVLTAALVEQSGAPQLELDPSRTPAFQRIELRAATRDEQLAALRELVAEEFDLATGPLVRAHLVGLPDRRRLLLITAHHLLLDGTSTALLVRDLQDAYRGTATPPRATFGDFTAWERDLLDGPASRAHREHWLRELDGAPAHLALPCDRRPDPDRMPRIRVLTREVPAQQAEALATWAARHRSGLATALFATWVAFLGKVTGQRDLVAGMTAAARPEERFQDVVGQFATRLPIRCTTTGDPGQVLESLRDTVLAAIEHSAYPLPEIARALGREDEPLARTNFLFQNFAGAGLLTGETTGEPQLRPFADLPYTGEHALAAEVYRSGAGFKVFLKYDANLFDDTTAQRLADEWFATLRAETDALEP
ncbi:SDR family NAD(P)-dependent oxidoreductase [Saccharopolyspora flava]|uniref:Acyl transferase domain-containing protein n=1 Tax=Saccharopolyspora flava TaxID=95161 RepID=A0A1I6TN19_9PSEU|nr:SDR family NAD(P)-dependent oxidoreductase [Saccharopolyspora flava]SFS90387.1 Acyl transferase domain-containing protein [Saccharopolyspora flava]